MKVNGFRLDARESNQTRNPARKTRKGHSVHSLDNEFDPKTAD